jgi:hypothetical protein
MKMRSRQYYMHRAVIFRNRHPLVGPLLWLIGFGWYISVDHFRRVRGNKVAYEA